LCGGNTFVHDFKILSLSGYNLILGMDWLEKYSPMLIHWGQKWLKFMYKGKPVQLQGVLPNTQACPTLSCIQFDSLTKQEAIEQLLELQVSCIQFDSLIKQEAIEQLLELQVTLSDQQMEMPAVVTELVNQFTHLFEEPKELPLKRWIDHAIPLIPGAQAFRLRPYRYTPQQKDEIEKQVAEMLKNGIIQQSTSPFASPVLLVKKKDGEW
jgi:hypothetical protein